MPPGIRSIRIRRDCAGQHPDQLVECPQILGWQGNGDHTVPEVTGLYQAAAVFQAVW